METIGIIGVILGITENQMETTIRGLMEFVRDVMKVLGSKSVAWGS